jgi:hypothetical protein
MWGFVVSGIDASFAFIFHLTGLSRFYILFHHYSNDPSRSFLGRRGLNSFRPQTSEADLKRQKPLNVTLPMALPLSASALAFFRFSTHFK